MIVKPKTVLFKYPLSDVSTLWSLIFLKDNRKNLDKFESTGEKDACVGLTGQAGVYWSKTRDQIVFVYRRPFVKFSSSVAFHRTSYRQVPPKW